MKTYKAHRESRIARLLRKRQLRKNLPPGEGTSPIREVLVERSNENPQAALAYSEEAEYLNSRAAMDSLEDGCNAEITEVLTTLATTAVQLETAVVEQHKAHRLEVAAYLARERMAAALNKDALAGGARHVTPRMRLLAIIGLALVDVVAFRAAAAYVLDASDDTRGYIETLIFAMISLGIAAMAAYGAHKVRAYLDARAADDKGDSADAARRDLLSTGVPLMVLAAVSLTAAALLRMQVLEDATPWVKVLVICFSLASLGGAMAIELKYANEAADRLADLTRASDKAAARLRKADAKLESRQGNHLSLEVKATTLWDSYLPRWTLQADVAAGRIAAARAERPDLFHPMGPDIKPIIEQRLKEFVKVIKAEEVIRQQALDTKTVLMVAKGKATAAYGPISDPRATAGTDDSDDQRAIELTDKDFELLASGNHTAGTT